MSDEVEHAPPYEVVEAKRTIDNVPVQFDWHDYLATTWAPGTYFEAGVCIRLRRRESRGLQFRCTVPGTSGRREPLWPQVAGGTVDRDGSAQWIAEPITTASLRTTIATSEWPSVSGVTLSAFSDDDLIYTAYVAGGSSGSRYEIKQRITLASSAAEVKEAVAVLDVQD